MSDLDPDPRIDHPDGWAWFGGNAITYVGSAICPRCGFQGDDARCTCIYYLDHGWTTTS
jgi:hypothetical protein